MSAATIPGRVESREFLLGSTASGERVTATLAVTYREGTATDREHREIAAPVSLSASFTTYHTVKPDPGRDWSRISDRFFVSAGQVEQAERMIADEDVSPALSLDTLRFIESTHARYHLNDMHAECAHMAELLDPAPEILSAYKAERAIAEPWRTPTLQGYRVDRVVCPETGYKYGNAWLVEIVPPEILARWVEIIGAHS